MPEIDATFTTKQLEKILSEQRAIQDDLRALRDDLRVLTAMEMRTNNTLNALLTEVYATHTRMGEISDRLRKIENPE